MRPTNNNNNNTRRPNPNGQINNSRSNPNGSPSNMGRRFNNNPRPSPSSGNAQSRTNAIYDRDEMSDIVNPAQRRHASNQQTKFLDLAKNAKQQGDRVEVEYYMQHVEHYTRVLNLAEAQDELRNKERNVNVRPPQQQQQQQNAQQVSQPTSQHNHDEKSEIEEESSDENAPHNGETEEQRLARVERNRAKRRNRRLKRNNYTGQGATEQDDAPNNDTLNADAPSHDASPNEISHQAIDITLLDEYDSTKPVAKPVANPTVTNPMDKNITEQNPIETDEVLEKTPIIARPTTPKIKRLPVRAKRESTIKKTPQEDLLENSGASLRDVLPAAKIDSNNVNSDKIDATELDN